MFKDEIRRGTVKSGGRERRSTREYGIRSKRRAGGTRSCSNFRKRKRKKEKIELKVWEKG